MASYKKFELKGCYSTDDGYIHMSVSPELAKVVKNKLMALAPVAITEHDWSGAQNILAAIDELETELNSVAAREKAKEAKGETSNETV